MNNINVYINRLMLKDKLSYEEWLYIFNGYLNNNVSDKEMTQILKIICTLGLSEKEIFFLVDIFIKSGDVLEVNSNFIDKHSTGGVGDKTTLIVLPILASLGVKISKMSGRALGYTGGTIDKLESIGVNTNLTSEEFYKCIDEVGMVISSQTDNLCPMDKKVYALRDVTGTTKSIPLIAISIMSKKIASGAGKILLDVKVGKGALVNNISDAKRLAKLMIKIGKKYDREVVCMLTNMDNPLGSNVGNKIEVLEVIDILNNKKKNDLSTLCVEMASMMYSMNMGISLVEAKKKVLEVIDNGLAYKKFEQFVKFQGGNLNIILPECEYVLAKRSGYIKGIDSKKIGKASMELGAGRKEKGDSIDFDAGIILESLVGISVKEGDILAKCYGKKDININHVRDAFEITLFNKKKKNIVLKIMR